MIPWKQSLNWIPVVWIATSIPAHGEQYKEWQGVVTCAQKLITSNRLHQNQDGIKVLTELKTALQQGATDPGITPQVLLANCHQFLKKQEESQGSPEEIHSETLDPRIAEILKAAKSTDDPDYQCEALPQRIILTPISMVGYKVTCTHTLLGETYTWLQPGVGFAAGLGLFVETRSKVRFTLTKNNLLSRENLPDLSGYESRSDTSYIAVGIGIHSVPETERTGISAYLPVTPRDEPFVPLKGTGLGIAEVVEWRLPPWKWGTNTPSWRAAAICQFLEASEG